MTGKVFTFVTTRGPNGAREALKTLAEDSTLEGVIILSLHGENAQAQYTSSFLSVMEKLYLAKILEVNLSKEIYE